MCGVAGWIDLKRDLTRQNIIIEKMSETLGNRGPDASGIWESPHALIAHRRLIVVDPSGGAQPMVRVKGEKTFVVTYNGELYNTMELRRELKGRGYVFRSYSDTEVLLIAYIEWGSQCVEYLNGIYAFGVWDDKERKLFLARDRFGVKPLFYAQRDSSFIFGSELKTLLVHPMIKSEIDKEGLSEVFALGPARTPGHGVFKGVYEVKPACCVTFSADGITEERYWELESHEHPENPEETIEKVRDLVRDSIERQFTADVPVCTFLSGGLDSSVISALAADYFRKRDGIQLHTYSVDYTDNEKYFKASSYQPDSDTPWIKRMADEFATKHHYITVDTPQLVDALTGAVLARDLPGMADVDSSLWLFCREVRKNAAVALSGECADEVFGGYPWFHSKETLEAKTFPWSMRMEERTKFFSRQLLEVIRPQEYVDRRYRQTLEEVPKLAGESFIEARRREMFYLNLTWFMTTLLDRKDRMSMYHGLEVRVPYCDHRLVQYVWNIPWEMKMLDGREKGLLRKALTGVLPDDVLYRRKSPYPKTHNPAYEKAVSRRLIEILNDGSSPLLPLIDIKAVEGLAGGKSDYGRPWFGQLMATPQMFAYLIQVDIWLREYNISIKV